MRLIRRPLHKVSSGTLWNFELLEQRFLFAAVAWTGAGDGANWTDPANWSNQAVPTINDDVTIADNSDVPVVIGSGAQAVNSLTSSGSISIDGASLQVATTANIARSLVVSDGGLVGGSWSAQQAITLQNSDTLAGVTFNSNVTLDSTAVVTATGGLTLNGTMTLQTLSDLQTGFTHAADLQFLGTQSLMGSGNVILTDNVRYQGFGMDTWMMAGDQQPILNPYWSSSLDVVDDGGDSPATLTIGPSMAINGGGLIGVASSTDATIVNDGLIQPDSQNGITLFIPLINNGSIVLSGSASNLNFSRLPTDQYGDSIAEYTANYGDIDLVSDFPQPIMLVNNGDINVEGGILFVEGAGWSNVGSMEVDHGYVGLGSGINTGSINAIDSFVSVNLDASLQTDFSPGSFNLTDSVLDMLAAGQTTDESIGRINFISDDVVYLAGTIDNTNSTILFDSGVSRVDTSRGWLEVDGGTMVIGDGVEFITGNYDTFNNLTVEISDGGDMLIYGFDEVNLRPEDAGYLDGDLTLDIADATGATLYQLYYDSPTGPVSIADELEPTAIPPAPAPSPEPDPPQAPGDSTPTPSDPDQPPAQTSEPSTEPDQPPVDAGPVSTGTAVKSTIVALPPGVTSAAPAVFSVKVFSVVSEIESGDSGIDDLLFGDKSILA
jgi:hypothetical protein